MVNINFKLPADVECMLTHCDIFAISWRSHIYQLRIQYNNYEGRTESHEQLFFLHANWEQQTKESAVVDGTSCYVILECLVTSIACIT